MPFADRFWSGDPLDLLCELPVKEEVDIIVLPRVGYLTLEFFWPGVIPFYDKQKYARLPDYAAFNALQPLIHVIQDTDMNHSLQLLQALFMDTLGANQFMQDVLPSGVLLP